MPTVFLQEETSSASVSLECSSHDPGEDRFLVGHARGKFVDVAARTLQTILPMPRTPCGWPYGATLFARGTTLPITSSTTCSTCLPVHHRALRVAEFAANQVYDSATVESSSDSN